MQNMYCENQFKLIMQEKCSLGVRMIKENIYWEGVIINAYLLLFSR